MRIQLFLAWILSSNSWFCNPFVAFRGNNYAFLHEDPPCMQRGSMELVDLTIFGQLSVEIAANSPKSTLLGNFCSVILAISWFPDEIWPIQSTLGPRWSTDVHGWIESAIFSLGYHVGPLWSMGGLNRPYCRVSNFWSICYSGLFRISS